jgi:hypothetical protein
MYCVTAAGFALLGLHTAAGVPTVAAAEVCSLVVTGLGAVSSVRAGTTFGIKFAQAVWGALRFHDWRARSRGGIAFHDVAGWRVLGDPLLLSVPRDNVDELGPSFGSATYAPPGVSHSTTASFADMEAAAACDAMQDFYLLNLSPPPLSSQETESAADWVARGHFTGYGLDEGEADWAARADAAADAAAPEDHVPGHCDAETHRSADAGDDDDALQAMHYERHEYEGAATLGGLLDDEATYANPLALDSARSEEDPTFIYAPGTLSYGHTALGFREHASGGADTALL